MEKRVMYGKWAEDELKVLAAAYRNANHGRNEFARIYRVPKATINRYADGKNTFSKEVKVFGRQRTFKTEMEEIVADYLLFKKRFFGFTIKDVRKLAFDIAEKYELPNYFNREKKMAGKSGFIYL